MRNEDEPFNYSFQIKKSTLPTLDLWERMKCLFSSQISGSANVAYSQVWVLPTDWTSDFSRNLFEFISLIWMIDLDLEHISVCFGSCIILSLVKKTVTSTSSASPNWTQILLLDFRHLLYLLHLCQHFKYEVLSSEWTFVFPTNCSRVPFSMWVALHERACSIRATMKKQSQIYSMWARMCQDVCGVVKPTRLLHHLSSKESYRIQIVSQQQKPSSIHC